MRLAPWTVLWVLACSAPSPKVHIQEPFEAAFPAAPDPTPPERPRAPGSPATREGLLADLPGEMRVLEAAAAEVQLRIDALAPALETLPAGADHGPFQLEVNNLRAAAASLRDRTRVLDERIRLLSAIQPQEPQ